MCQCEHEFAKDRKLVLSKYDHRWLNDHQYDLRNIGRNTDEINTSVAVTNDDTTFSFEPSPNKDQPYIKNQGTVTKKDYSSL